MLRCAILLLFAASIPSVPALRVDPRFKVDFEIETPDGPGKFTVDVHPSWAPRAAARFKDLVNAGFYDDTRFYKVIPGEVAQFGINGDPAAHAEWHDKTFNDDHRQQSNHKSFVSFVKYDGANTRTTEILINLGANERAYDKAGHVPFGIILAKEMPIVHTLYPVMDDPDRDTIVAEGNAYLDKNFPQISKIISATIHSEHEDDRHTVHTEL